MWTQFGYYLKCIRLYLAFKLYLLVSVLSLSFLMVALPLVNFNPSIVTSNP